MSLLRLVLRDHPRLAALLLVAALCMKALMPAGFMVEARPSAVSIAICGESSGVQLGRAVALRDKFPASSGSHGAADQTCPFAALGMAALGSGDSPFLVLAVVFALALVFLPARREAAGRVVWLRPPLRAPPAVAVASA